MFGPSGDPVKRELVSTIFLTMEYAPHSALRLYGCGRSEVMAAPDRARLQSSSLRPHTLLSRTPREVMERLIRSEGAPHTQQSEHDALYHLFHGYPEG